MAAPPGLTGPVLRPEGVDHLGAFPLVAAALIRWQIKGIDVCRSSRCNVDPATLMTAGTGRRIERLDERLDHGLDVLKEHFHLFGVATGELVPGDEPRDSIHVHLRLFESSRASSRDDEPQEWRGFRSRRDQAHRPKILLSGQLWSTDMQMEAATDPARDAAPADQWILERV